MGRGRKQVHVREVHVVRKKEKKEEKEEKVRTEDFNLIIQSVPIIVHMTNYTKKKTKCCVSPHKKVIFFLGVLGEEYSAAGSKITFSRQAPNGD